MTALGKNRDANGWVDDEGHEAPAPVADRETGEIRVLADRCTTCLLNPAATAVPLAPGRLQNFVRATHEASGHVICHSTLPPLVPEGTPAAMCRGYITPTVCR